jgi:hypothetical protein
MVSFFRLTEISHVGFDVLTAVVMKSPIFWDITPCSPLKVYRCFGGTYRLQLQGRRISPARSTHNYSFFGLFLSSGILENRNTTFRKLDLFPSSGEGEDTYSVGALRKSWSQSLDILAACFMLVSCLAYFSTLKMEATCSSETSADF